MTIPTKIITLVLVLIVTQAAWSFWGQTASPLIATDVALAAVNGGTVENQSVRLYYAVSDYVQPVLLSTYAILAYVLFFPRTKQPK